jgi:hypothetical protein
MNSSEGTQQAVGSPEDDQRTKSKAASTENGGSTRERESDVKPLKDIESGSTSETVPNEESEGGSNAAHESTSDTARGTVQSSEARHIQSMEIDMNNGEEGTEADESFESDGSMDHLLGDNTNDGTDKSTQEITFPLCSRPQKIGNMNIFLPSMFYKTGWGIAGPHWFGPFCVMFLIGLASHYFIGISMRRIGPITTAICLIFTAACAYNLVNVAYRDPGVVKLQPNTLRPDEADEDQRLQFRWCDRCQVFQPVDGAHCSDCNVCIAGFDQ